MLFCRCQATGLARTTVIATMSQTATPSDALRPFPELPTELVLHILRSACCVSHDTALSVSRVSSWVRTLVLPLVFSTVVRRAGPPMPSGSGWATPQGVRPSSLFASILQRGSAYAHLLPPTTRDVGQHVRHLWIESINVMSSPGELGIFDACTNIEDVALSASSLRMLYNSTLFGKRSPQTGAQKDVARGYEAEKEGEEEEAATRTVHSTLGAASRIRSITLTKHTFRYDWHFLSDLNATSDTHTSLLGNITHLRLTAMEKSTYVPVEYLANLTHLALPYSHLRANNKADIVRVPDGLLRREDAPTLKMIVLTVDEREWLYKPWKHGAHTRSTSPRSMFKTLRAAARGRDDRLRVLLSPRMGRDVCNEWAEAARGAAPTVWELAAKVRDEEEYANILPTEFPPPDLRYTLAE